MGEASVLSDLADGILTVTLNRPAVLNAFNQDVMDGLMAALDRADADDDVKVVVLTGAGRAFCAGADMSAGADTFDAAKRPDKQHNPVPILPDGSSDYSSEAARDRGGVLTLRMFECRKPIIAAVNGAAVGIGLSMLLAADIRLASQTARFGFVFTRRGIVPESASAWFLPRIVGISKALEWCYTGRLVPAADAHASGLVSAVHAPEDLLPAAYALATEIAQNTAPVAIALTRQMIWRLSAADHPMEAHRIDSRAILSRGKSSDAREGVTSFLEKRPARFRDKVSTDMPDFFPWFDAPRYS